MSLCTALRFIVNTPYCSILYIISPSYYMLITHCYCSIYDVSVIKVLYFFMICHVLSDTVAYSSSMYDYHILPNKGFSH